MRDQHRRSKKVETKMKIGSKYRDQKCIFALNIKKASISVFALNLQMHQAVLDLYYNNFIWCETRFYLLQQNILMWNKWLLIATTLFWCEIRFNYYNNTFRCNKVILATILNWCNTFKLLLQQKVYFSSITTIYFDVK